jgi:hypothetical protein
LISYGTLALEYTVVRRNGVSLKIFAGLEQASSDMLGHSFWRKTPIKKNAL